MFLHPRHRQNQLALLPFARPARPALSRLFFLVCLLALGACAAQPAEPPLQLAQSGRLPEKGTVCLRSGLEWMDETSPLFRQLEAALVPLLREQGLTVVAVAPSAPVHRAARPKSRTGGKGANQPLRLERYDIPEKDADLPASVLAVRPPDPRTVLFARSQQQGTPVMPQWGRIPGRVPAELGTHDPAVAEYALVCRFAAIKPLPTLARLNDAAPDAVAAAAAPAPDDDAIYLAQLDDIVTAAGPIRGVGTMGYGSPAPASRPPSSYGSTPGDYRRGYEGPSPSPGDPWNRESDFKARDYTTRHGPQPGFAAPPQSPQGTPSTPRALPALPRPPLPGDQDGLPGGADTVPNTPAAPAAPLPGRGGTGAPDAQGGDGAGYALEMELYALGATPKGQGPALLWRAEVRQQATATGLGAALPGMAAHALQKGR